MRTNYLVLLTNILMIVFILNACAYQPQYTNILNTPTATNLEQVIPFSSAENLGQVTPQVYSKNLDLKPETYRPEDLGLPADIYYPMMPNSEFAAGYQNLRQRDNDGNFIRNGTILTLVFFAKDAQGEWQETGFYQHEDYNDIYEVAQNNKYWVVRLQRYFADIGEISYRLIAIKKSSGEQTDIADMQQIPSRKGLWGLQMVGQQLYYFSYPRQSEDPNNILYHAYREELNSIDMETLEKELVYQVEEYSLVDSQMKHVYDIDNKQVLLTERNDNLLYILSIDLNNNKNSVKYTFEIESDFTNIQQIFILDRFICFSDGGEDHNLYLFDPERNDFLAVPYMEFIVNPSLIDSHLYLQIVQNKALTIYRYDLLKEQESKAVTMDIRDMGDDIVTLMNIGENEGNITFTLIRYPIDGSDIGFYSVTIEF